MNHENMLPHPTGPTSYSEIISNLEGEIWDLRKDLATWRAKSEEYEAMLAATFIIYFFDSAGKTFEILKNSGRPGSSPNVDKWFDRQNLDVFYDSPFEAFAALNAAANDEQ